MTPRYQYLIALSLGQTTIATFSADHNFTVGEIVSFRVSPPYGTKEINEKSGKVLSITPDTITVDIDSINFTPFIYPVSGPNTPPVVVPSASGVIPNYYPPTYTLFDVFDNIPI